MLNPYIQLSPPSQNFDKTAALYYFDETLRALLYAAPAYFTSEYILSGFQVPKNTTEFSSSLIAGIITGTSILFSMATYYSNKKLLKSAQEVWLTTWSNFTFLLWAENYTLGQALKWTDSGEVIPGTKGSLVFVSLFLVGMFFSINNEGTKKFIADFFPQLIQSSMSKPRRVTQKIYNIAAKFFEGVGLGNAIVDPFIKILGSAANGINWAFMVSLGIYKGAKEYVPSIVSRVVNYPRQLWQRLWYGSYQEIESPPEEAREAPSAATQEPQFAFLTGEDRFGSILYLPAILRRISEFNNPYNALPIILAVLGKALLTPLLENRETYAVLNQQLKKPSDPSSKEEEEEESPEFGANLEALFEPEAASVTEEKRKKLKEEEEEEEKTSEFTS